jgi:hypothetical protein
MSDAHPLLIDDVSVALTGLSEVGRAIVAPAALQVRANVLMMAAALGWRVVRYEEFARWIDDRMQTGALWVLLDPLHRLRSIPSDSYVLRVHRVGTDNIVMPGDEALEHLRERSVGRHIALLDDVAATGRTLEEVARRLESLGMQVAEVAVCAGTPTSQSRLTSRRRTMEWRQFVPGPYTGVHLRDACPFLPYAGRRSARHAPVQGCDGDIEIRVPSLAVTKSVWQQIYRDPRIAWTVRGAREHVARELSRLVGREAVAADVRLLGSAVAVTAFPWQQVVSCTTLGSLATVR